MLTDVLKRKEYCGEQKQFRNSGLTGGDTQERSEGEKLSLNYSCHMKVFKFSIRHKNEKGPCHLKGLTQKMTIKPCDVNS